MHNNILMYPHIALAKVKHDESLCPRVINAYLLDVSGTRGIKSGLAFAYVYAHTREYRCV